MAISFVCEGCGKDFTVGDELAGKKGKCKQCGHLMLIPHDRDEVGYGLSAAPSSRHPAFPDDDDDDDDAPLPPRPKSSWATRPASDSARLGNRLSDRRREEEEEADDDPWAAYHQENRKKPSKQAFLSPSTNKVVSGILTTLLIVGLIALKVWLRVDRKINRNLQNNQANAAGNRGPGVLGAGTANRTGPIRLPSFPNPGPAQEIQPGVMLHEVKLGPPNPIPSIPGHRGKLWLYLPSGNHQAKSLPCVMITGAGSNLLVGMDLGDGDRAEHLPYVKAGFAVLAFELDGALADMKNATDQQMQQSMMAFLNARAGLVNAHIALEYLLAKVPQVNPSKISVAGHSSAGTLAVLFAENEPRLRACVAFAPALDLPARFGNLTNQLISAGFGELVLGYSPSSNIEKLKHPLYLFHAQDDSNIPIAVNEAIARQFQSRGKDVTFDIVPTGEHYDSMIQEGIPRAINWLNNQGAGPSQ